ncbi:MAG: hypothetical protein ACKVQA_03915 [Burkholderiales bacterium]
MSKYLLTIAAVAATLVISNGHAGKGHKYLDNVDTYESGEAGNRIGEVIAEQWGVKPNPGKDFGQRFGDYLYERGYEHGKALRESSGKGRGGVR